MAEKSVELLTKSKKTSIKDFDEGEIKTISLQDGGKEFLKDRSGNLLTYKWSDEQAYMKLKPYGDNFIQPYKEDLTWKNFLIKVQTIYFIFYEKYQPDGPSNVEEAKVVNILKFCANWYKDLKKEFELIQQIVNSVNLDDENTCKKAQSYVRDTNKLLIIKRFCNGRNYEWQLFFKDKKIIEHGEFLINYKNVKIYEDGDEALLDVYKLASDNDIKVINDRIDKSLDIIKDLFWEVEKQEMPVKKQEKPSNVSILEPSKKQNKIYNLACDLSPAELSQTINKLLLLSAKNF